ncbi:hypothetical protein PG995_009248 [Apiospora arundinis]
MPGKTLSPETFQKRSNGRSSPIRATTPFTDEIVFPQVYEDAWGAADALRSEIERARIFLYRMGNMNPDQSVRTEVKSIVQNPAYRTVPALAAAVQTRVFMGRHATFAATPILQCVRFMLIRARVADVVFTERTRAVMDFFFDPTLARNNPGDEVLTGSANVRVVTYPYPAARLKVAIIGGGPTALALAISLAEKGAGRVEVHVWERRWVENMGPQGTYVDYPPDAKRRDQVVTLQDSVTSLLTPATREALFERRPEPVWPGSANIQIRKVEDRLLRRCQASEFRDKSTIHLHAEGVTREELSKVGDFHVLLGADGAASWIRKSYFHGYEKERGKSFALGLAFDRPAGLPWSQPLNVFLTLGQTRYLLNASDYDGRGYLNMQLTEEEWHKMVSVNGEPVTFGRPGCLRAADGSIPAGFAPNQVFAPSEDRSSPLWRSIEDGLKLFGFKENEVTNVVRIPIVVQAVLEGAQYLPPTETTSLHRPHALVAVAGDAAMTVHFWPGRGLNSGIKSGIALGDELVSALDGGRFIGLPLDALRSYNDFLLQLQNREHDKRSLPILNQSGSPETLGWLMGQAPAVPDAVAVEWLVGAATQIAERLQRRADWPFEVVANVEPQIRIVLRQLSSATLRQMAVSFPWPTREMAGAEVLPVRSMQPEEKQKWLQQLWGLLRDEQQQQQHQQQQEGWGKHVRAQSRFDGRAHASSASLSRFEAPRPSSWSLPSSSSSPLARSRASSVVGETGGLKRSNGTRSAAPPRFRTSYETSIRSTVTSRRSGEGGRGGEDGAARDRSPGNPVLSPRPTSASGNHDNDGVAVVTADGLGRMLSVARRPGRAVLADAMSLALFRVQGD